jgi:ABC-type multidrug transport system fused ATPase/permease subunit
VVTSIRESARVCSLTNSPIISYLTETIQGTSTIRAFGYSEIFIEGQAKLINQSILATQMRMGVLEYFRIRVDISATTFVAIICAICIISRENTDPVLLSLLLTYAMNIQNNLTYLLMNQMSIETLMVNAERCMQMTEVEQERASDETVEDRPNWPERG